MRWGFVVCGRTSSSSLAGQGNPRRVFADGIGASSQPDFEGLSRCHEDIFRKTQRHLACFYWESRAHSFSEDERIE
jgi:hypothetical protein